MSQFNLGWIPLIQQELRKFFASKGQGDKADTALQPGAIGTTVQGYDADLAAIAALNTNTNGVVARTGAGTATIHPTGTAGIAVLAAADAAAARTAIGAMANTAPAITTNANGTAYRWPNGLQICTFVGEAQTTTTASGNVFRSSSGTIWTYPAAFNSVPFLFASISGSSERWMGWGANVDGISASYRQYSTLNSSTSAISYVAAIGTYTP